MKTSLTVLALTVFILPAYSQQEKTDWTKKLNTRVSIDKQNEAVVTIINELAREHDFKINVDPRVPKDYEDGLYRASFNLKEVALRNLIRMLLEQHGLVAVHKDGNIVIKRKEDVDKDYVIRVYDIGDIFTKIQDNPVEAWIHNPFALSNIGQGRSRTFALDDGNVVLGPPPSAGALAPATPAFTEMLKRLVGSADDWSNPQASAEIFQGKLVVSQNLGMHKEVKSFLKKLREAK